MILATNGCLIDYNTFYNKVGMNGIRRVKNAFTITTIGHNNIPKKISSFKQIDFDGKRTISIPRFGGFMLQKTGLIKEIKNTLSDGLNVDIDKSTLELSDNQNIVLSHLMDNIYTEINKQQGRGSTILQMDPGYGKTYLAIGLINLLKKKTFIIVPNTYLLKQWVDALKISFPNNRIGTYYGLKKTDGDIIVSILNSALSYPASDYYNCGLIIYDEVHMYCSKKTSEIFRIAQSTYCLGLTATPNERLDNFNKVAVWALGNVIRANNIPGWNFETSSFKTVVECIKYSGPANYTKIIESKTGIVSVPLLMNQLQLDPHRNDIIVNSAIKLYNMGRNVFIFSDRRCHLLTLAALLDSQRINYEAPEIKTLMGGSSDIDIEDAKKNSRIILTTYQYSGTGVSINKMDSIVLATPRKSNMKQILGRIYRLSGNDNVVRYIIDIVDSKICLKSQFYTRKKTYIELHAEINYMTMKWDDKKTLL